MSLANTPDLATAQHLLTATLSQRREGEVYEERLVHATLHVLGPEETASYVLPYPRAVGGRSEHADIPLMHGSVSSAHFELTFGEHAVMLRDLGSRNGTWVGRARVHDSVELHDGAEFFAGGCSLRIEFGGEQARPIAMETSFHGLLGTSKKMRELFALLSRVAPLPLSVLLLGETGTGKEEVARALHLASGRPGPLEVLDCSNIPRELSESVIHGYRRGAFTGATTDRPGAFEQAAGGTLLIDEIGEMPLDLQPKLLRVLDRGEIQRVGDTQVRPVDVRVLAATNRDLQAEVAAGRFRADLFHRLAQLTIALPPLRDHPEDIAVLARHFLVKIAATTGQPLHLTDEAIALLTTERWPGNVRELKTVVERTGYLTRAPGIRVGDVILDAEGLRTVRDHHLFGLPLKEALEILTDRFARDYCQQLIARHGGDLDAVAATMGYSRKGLRELMRRVGLRDD